MKAASVWAAAAVLYSLAVSGIEDCGNHIHSSTDYEGEKKTWRLPNVQQTICGSEVSVIL